MTDVTSLRNFQMLTTNELKRLGAKYDEKLKKFAMPDEKVKDAIAIIEARSAARDLKPAYSSNPRSDFNQYRGLEYEEE